MFFTPLESFENTLFKINECPNIESFNEKDYFSCIHYTTFVDVMIYYLNKIINYSDVIVNVTIN